MTQTLEGQYYEAKKEGYTNRGTQTIQFKAKVNYLPVFSRCNKLLKHENHHLELQPRDKLDQVHCYSSSSLLDRNSPLKNENLNTSNIILKHRQNSPKIYKIGNQSLQKYIKDLHHKNNSDYKQKNQKQKFSFSPKSLNTQPNACMNYEEEADQSTRKYKVAQHLNNPLKQSISPINCSQSLKQAKNDQKTTHIDYSRYKYAKKYDNEQDENQLSCNTEHTYGKNNYKNVYRNHKNHNKEFLGAEKVLDELSNILYKVGRLQQKIRQSQQQFKVKLLQNEINKSTSLANQLHQQNLKLKKAMHEKTLNLNGCACSCVRKCKQTYKNQNQKFIYFVIFILGMLFTKAFFC